MAEKPGIKVKLLKQTAVTPTKATSGSSGYDLYAAEAGCVLGLQTAVIGVGIALEIPSGYEGQIRPRSGLASRGITIINSPGTIDSDYRGEIKVMIHNTSCENYHYEMGDRIAQIVFKKAPEVKLVVIPYEEPLTPTERNEGGLGSTGN